MQLSFITPLYATSPKYFNDLIECFSRVATNRNKIQWVLVNDQPANPQIADLIRCAKECLKNVDVVEVTNPSNLGIFRAYYQGFKAASGDYCTILDHDDVLDVGYLASYRFPDNCDFVYSNEYKFSDESKNKDIFEKPNFDPLSILFYFYTHHVSLFKTAVVNKILSSLDGDFFETDYFYSISSAFDLWLLSQYLLEIFPYGESVHFIEKPIYGWRIHVNSTAHSIEQKPINSLARLLIFERFFQEYGQDPLAKINPEAPYAVCSLFQNKFRAVYDGNWSIIELGTSDSNIVSRLTAVCMAEELEIIRRYAMNFPLHYLAEKTRLPIFIPMSWGAEHWVKEHPDIMRHIPHVALFRVMPYQTSWEKSSGMFIYPMGIEQDLKKDVPVAVCFSTAR